MGLKSWFSRRAGPAEELDDLSWTIPPDDTQSPEVWDAFWMKHYEMRVSPRWFELFTDDTALVRTMRENGLRTILCIGNGIGQEPRALAAAGFDVTALDISRKANEIMLAWHLSDEYMDRIVGPDGRAPGGGLRCATGDLRDRSLCPGPYDVIIERLTLQLFGVEGEEEAGIAAVRARLNTPGILFSHCHNGKWRPGQPRVHLLQGAYERMGWNIIVHPPEAPMDGQVAWLFFSTG